MRTNIILDDELIELALRYSGLKTKKEVVHKALLEFVATLKQKDLRDLKGKIQFQKGYDYKSLRKGK
jgi:Arc/MetJ family transcription regulator